MTEYPSILLRKASDWPGLMWSVADVFRDHKIGKWRLLEIHMHYGSRSPGRSAAHARSFTVSRSIASRISTRSANEG